MSFNNIRSIGQHTFVNLPKLEELHLDDNRLQTLDRRSFMNLEHIKRLNLKGNKIFNISFETFQNLPELEDLDISYNALTSFDFSMFDQVGTLSIFRVNASHNKLKDLLVNVPMVFASQTGKCHTSNTVFLELRKLLLNHMLHSKMFILKIHSN